MSADVAGATEKKGRGGPRGPRQWKDEPTLRERVMTQSLADYVKTETGRDVSPETIRAVRHCLPKWGTSDETAALRKNMSTKLEKAKLQDKRSKALAALREAESELAKLTGSADIEEDDDEDDEDTYEDVDDSDDEDEDVFDGEKVSTSF